MEIQILIETQTELELKLDYHNIIIQIIIQIIMK